MENIVINNNKVISQNPNPESSWNKPWQIKLVKLGWTILTNWCGIKSSNFWIKFIGLLLKVIIFNHILISYSLCLSPLLHVSMTMLLILNVFYRGLSSWLGVTIIISRNKMAPSLYKCAIFLTEMIRVLKRCYTQCIKCAMQLYPR